jgi:hypothetical protein
LWAQSHRKGSAPAEWLQDWNIRKFRENPPTAPKIPRKLKYLYAYVEDIPYVRAQQVGETPNAFRKRVYDTMYILNMAGLEQKEMSVVRQNPETDWKRVWTNLHDAWTAETITAVWYAVIHD